MSEQNQRNNWPQKISPEVPEEILRVPIPVEVVEGEVLLDKRVQSQQALS
jgi:hypothetical protein